MLCHNKNANYIENFTDYNTITIDKNNKTDPHIISDVLNFSIYEQFKDQSFDIIIIFNCSCHTQEINKSKELLPVLKRILKSEGILYLKQNKPSDKVFNLLTSAGYEVEYKEENQNEDFLIH